MKKLNMLALVLLAGCVATPVETVPSDRLTLADRQDAPQLAMMEYILADYFHSDITDPPTVCAAVQEGREQVALSPRDETALIARFPQLAPLSRCSYTDAGWRDNETEEPALVFTLHSFTCDSDERCTGWASYNTQERVSVSQLYTADWRDGAWRFSVDPGIVAE